MGTGEIKLAGECIQEVGTVRREKREEGEGAFLGFAVGTQRIKNQALVAVEHTFPQILGSSGFLT